MREYLDLMEWILARGDLKEQRAQLSDGTRPRIWSLFGEQLRFDLSKGFPLLTTKKMPFKAIWHELKWFLSGDTNIRYLKENGVGIWDKWANAEGDLGPVYGRHWRAFEGPQGPVDQVAKLLRDIQKVLDNPHASEARRLIISSWHPANMPDPSVPTGCHTMVQFNVTQGKLSAHMYQRSCDAFLGLPFNISCYALLTYMLAHYFELKPRDLVISFGDVHIYENHLEAVQEQLKRIPYQIPELMIDCDPKQVLEAPLEAFRLVGYRSHGKLTGEVAV